MIKDFPVSRVQAEASVQGPQKKRPFSPRYSLDRVFGQTGPLRNLLQKGTAQRAYSAEMISGRASIIWVGEACLLLPFSLLMFGR